MCCPEEEVYKPLETREEALAGAVSRLIVLQLSTGKADELPELVPALVEVVLWPYLGSEQAVEIAAEAGGSLGRA